MSRIRPSSPETINQLVSILATAIEQSADAIVITDASGRIEFVNAAFTAITGYSKQEALGQNPRILASGKHDKAFYKEMWLRLTSGEPWRGKLVNKRKDGTLYTSLHTISPIKNAAGVIVRYVSDQKDVTREEALESQYKAAQRLEAVARLAGGVAHDFNNHLSVILGYVKFLEDALAGPDPVDPAQLKADVAEVKKAAVSSAELTRQLLAFSRRQVIQPAVMDLNSLISELEKMLQRVIGENVVIKSVLDPELPPIKADPAQLEQVLMNLVVNARDAMPAGGAITINTSVIDEGGRPWARLAVKDSGHGIPPEVLPNIFEPFFTTKPTGKGTGLGLPTVLGIVEQSGGRLAVDTKVNVGTVFTVDLPLADIDLEPEKQTPAVPTRITGNETILLVEDDASVLQIAARTLRANNYTVFEAASPGEALLIGEEGGREINLLVTDVVMPHMNGWQLADRLGRRHPKMKRLFISGHTEEDVLGRPEVEDGRTFLAKPFTLEVLGQKVRSVLDGAAPLDAKSA